MKVNNLQGRIAVTRLHTAEGRGRQNLQGGTQTDRHAEQTDRLTDRRMDTCTNRQTDIERQADRQTDGRTDGYTDRQTDRHRQTDLR